MDSLVQNLPDETTQPMGNRPDGLCVPQARYQTAIHNLEDTSFGLTSPLRAAANLTSE
jgi:hypothetical protein